MEKFIIVFEGKSYTCDYQVYTSFGTAVDRAFDSYEEAYNVLVNEIIPEVQASIDESYIETAKEEGVSLDELRDLSIETYKPKHSYDLVASVELYDREVGSLLEENKYKIIPLSCQ